MQPQDNSRPRELRRASYFVGVVSVSSVISVVNNQVLGDKLNSDSEILAVLGNIRVVLDHTSHPGNIGSAARAMKTMGLSRLHLVAPRVFPHREADALAVSAADVLAGAQVHTNLDDALAGCAFAVGLTARSRDLMHETLDPRSAARRLLPLAASQPVALLFGNETAGLSNEELRKCQWRVAIPTNPDCSSLNLAAAVQVMAYELRMAALEQQAPAVPDMPTLATLDELERFYQRLEQTLVAIDFLDPESPKLLMPRLRRLFARGRVEQEEFHILMGILKQVRRAIGGHGNTP